MKTKQIKNLLSGSDNELPKFATKMWHVIPDKDDNEYGGGNDNDTTVNLTQRLPNQVFAIIQMHIFL